LFAGKTEAAKYASEYLIVIDDPVSSFDYGNRVGVMSLLRFQFGNILKGNANSRILVMSHDLHSVFDLVKIRNEVVDISNSDRTLYMELANNKLEVKKLKNEYKKLLEQVYGYAANIDAADPDETQEMSIGNIMRRMLEAFSTFCYNTSFEKMLRKEDILTDIPEEKRSYYGNFMYRLTLNTESHMEEYINTLNSITSCFTKEEKVQTAKSVLLFLLYINKPHLAAYLEEGQLAVIEGWKSEEEGWILSEKE
jgi:wobble nucleotide-excising tRNase